MIRKKEQESAKYKAGIFIIASICLLIFCILWLRHFAVKPVIKITAVFESPGPLSKGLSAYYKGVNVGRITDVEFSDDLTFTKVRIGIYNKKIKLPKNTKAKINSAGITGKKYIELVYPKNPSLLLLSNGDTIKGIKPFNINSLQEFFQRQIQSGKLDNMVTTMEKTLITSDDIANKIELLVSKIDASFDANKGDVERLIKTGMSIANDVSNTTSKISSVMDKPGICGDLSDTLHATAEVSRSLQEILDDECLKSDLKNGISNFNCASQSINRTFSKAESTVDDVNCVIQGFKEDEDYPNMIKHLICNANSAAKKVDCLSENLSEMLSKRFLLIRMLFGRPGKELEECNKLK